MPAELELRDPTSAEVQNRRVSRIALCLSGGGFRATYFHLGVVRALRDTRFKNGVPLLESVSHISSVSGGSILSAYLVLNWEKFIGSKAQYGLTEEKIIKFGQIDARGIVVRRWLLGILLYPVLFFTSLANRTRTLQNTYDKYLYKNATLQSLLGSTQTSRPVLHILSTSLTTGELIAFSGIGVSTSARPNAVPAPFGSELISLAVTASSAFPPLFPPVMITRDQLGLPIPDMPHSEDYLTDGGVFDNLGFAKIMEIMDKRDADFDAILMVDAGASFEWNVRDKFSWITSRTARSIDILMRLAAQATIRSSESSDLRAKVCRINIRDEMSESPWASLPAQYRLRTKKIRTDLDKFSEFEIQSLIQHGYEACLHSLTKAFPEDLEASVDQSAPTAAEASANGVKDLDRAAQRQLRLFSFGDWPSYPSAIVVGLLLSAMVFSIFGFPYVWTQRTELIQETAKLDQKTTELNEQTAELNENERRLRSQEDSLAAIARGPEALRNAYLSEFRVFFADLNLKHFSPEELLFLGAANSDPSSRAFGLNTYPPKALWPNIRPTLVALDALADMYNSPIRIISAYRTSAYSRAIGGGEDSAHELFYAVDFTIATGSPQQWANDLRKLRSAGVFKGGIGIYPTYVHVDTRGLTNRDWKG